jgi:hypothetical protein
MSFPLLIQGPNHLTLELKDGIFPFQMKDPFTHKLDRGNGLYHTALILYSNKTSIHLENPSGWKFDGDFATSNGINGWSKDGRYIVLQYFFADEDGNWSTRDVRLAAFDTHSGRTVTFKSATSALGNNTFVRWSTEAPDVVILRGKNGEEEGHLVKDN